MFLICESFLSNTYHNTIMEHSTQQITFSLELTTIFMEQLNKNKMDNVLGVSSSTHERFISKVN